MVALTSGPPASAHVNCGDELNEQMISLADKIRRQLKAGKTPKEIAAMFGTSDNYVRVVRQRTGADGLPKLTAADKAWELKQRQSPDRKEYLRQNAREYRRRKAAKANGNA